MKFVAFGGLLFLLVMSVGCTNSTKPVAPAPIYGEIQYNGSTYVFGDVECIVACTDGGEPTYSLSIRFTDGEGRSIRFSIQDEQDNPENLVTAGEHLATGQRWDGVASWMQPASFFINYLSEGQLAVFWDQIDLQENSFTGRGYIRLKERIEHEPGYLSLLKTPSSEKSAICLIESIREMVAKKLDSSDGIKGEGSRRELS